MYEPAASSRYRFRIKYDGTNFAGWQRQPNALSIQEVIETELEKLVPTVSQIRIVGCGRTDAGVHASDYYFHADLPAGPLTSDDYHYKLNGMLPASIAMISVDKVSDNWHARFDAKRRSYQYHIHGVKDPFINGYSFFWPYTAHIDLNKLEQVATALLKYEDFSTFCKAHSDVKHYLCHIHSSGWSVSEEGTNLIFHISANRFLRGMIRLIVGASLNVASGKISLSELELALDQRKKLRLNWSVPPQGLFLSKIEY